MFDEIKLERFLTMTDQELRWFHNVKKAFHESDMAYIEGRADDVSVSELCKAVDTAKTLRRSLRGEDTSHQDNKKRFLEFLNLELPSSKSGKSKIELVHAQSGKKVSYSFAELIYDIRCNIHENENLSAAEAPNYHILLDWSLPHSSCLGTIVDGRLTCNGRMIWQRLREILAMFITSIDGVLQYTRIVASNQPGAFEITSDPQLGSIRPNPGDRG
jgi:hypothetical protein